MPLTTIFSALLLAVTGPAGFDLPCFYNQKGAGGMLERAPHCARREAGRLAFNPDVLRKMAFYEDGLSAVATDGGWHWVRADGASASVLTYDNGPDEFEAGLARGRLADGTMAYYDKQLNVALATPYQWAEPFIDGIAVVCSRCGMQPTADGEHTMVVDGDWGAIDRQGRLVLPLRGDAASLRREADAARQRR